MSLTKRYLGAFLFLALGSGLAYWLLYLPLMEADHTGELTYYLKAVLLPPMCFYIGIVMLITDIGDGQIRQLDARGKPTLTRKGWYFVSGMVVVILAAFALWEIILRRHGFTIF